MVDKVVVLAAIKPSCDYLQHLDMKLKTENEVILMAAKGGKLIVANDARKKDTKIVLAEVKQNGDALQYARNKLKEDKEVEQEKEDIQDLVKDFSLFEGFFKAYQDPETSDIYLVIEEKQLSKEFIYFAHVVDGVVASRRNKGSYLDNGIFKIEK